MRAVKERDKKGEDLFIVGEDKDRGMKREEAEGKVKEKNIYIR